VSRATPLAIAILVVGLILGACFSERGAPTGTEDVECSIALPVPGPNEVLVAIRDFAFHPSELRVSVGTTVTWINCEPATTAAHTSTADDGAWASPSLPSVGSRFSRTFASPGRFGYHCAPHPFMQGTVIVEG
jgi:plastocyanin